MHSPSRAVLPSRASGVTVRRWSATLLAIGMGLMAALPSVGADFRAMPLPLEPAPRSGRVALAPGEVLTPASLEQALRADAAKLWQRGDAGAGLSLRVQAVTWRDGALGCPQPDRMYTQALVPGWLAVVSDGVRQARYHASRSGFWLECPAQLAQPPLPDEATR